MTSVDRSDNGWVTVSVPHGLRPQTGNKRVVRVRADTIRGVIDALDRAHPGLRFGLCHETGELRPFVNLFLDRENIRYLEGLDTPVPPDATIHIIHSVAGG